MSRLFGTDGVRGMAGEELTGHLAYRIGLSSGYLIKKEKDHGQVVIGRDTRLSGSMLKSALAAGYMQAGIDVLDLGVIPTPAIAYLINKLGFDGGAMVSASHNPYYDNGIKLFDDKGYKLSDEEEDQIEKVIKSKDKIPYATHEDIGKKTYGLALKSKYEAYLKSLVPGGLDGMKIALDCGNGALSEIGPRILQEMGARVYSINTQPDGKNINANCGSTNPDLIARLTVEKSCDIGFSFDGDADRLIAADNEGNIINGDHIMAIYAQNQVANDLLENKALVATIMSNMGLENYLESIGVELIRADVGDKFVLEKMLEGGHSIGGEQSGHLIFLDYNTTGDGMASALHLAKILKEDVRSAKDLNHLYEDYPQILLNAKVENGKKYSFNENENIVKKIQEIDQKFSKTGRVNVRASGTEPLVRVMIEHQDEDQLEASAQELVDLIESELG